MVQKPTYAQVIQSSGFKFLWANQIFLQIAYNCLNFALLIWVFRLTNSVVSTSALMLTILFPAILFGVFAGVLVDISDRKKIIVITDLLLVTLFSLLVVARYSYWAILLISFLLNSILQFFVPAEGSSIPIIVQRRLLFLANSLFQITLFGSLVLGYSLAGPIISFFGITTIFVGGAVLIFLGFLFAQNLPSITSEPDKYQQKLIKHLKEADFTEAFFAASKQIRETFQFIKGRLPIAVSIFILAGVQGVVGTLAVIIPAYMERVMHIRATDASYIVMLPLGLGMVIGALLIGKFAQNLPKRTLVTRGVTVAGLVLVLLGIASILGQAFSTLDLGDRFLRVRRSFLHAPSLSGFIAILAFVLGTCTVSVIIPSQTVLQEYTPENKRGKIFAVLAVFMSAFATLPVLIAGGIADLLGVIPVMVGLGLIVLAIGVVGFRPSYFLKEDRLPFRFREFLGLGHWEDKKSA